MKAASAASTTFPSEKGPFVFKGTRFSDIAAFRLPSIFWVLTHHKDAASYKKGGSSEPFHPDGLFPIEALSHQELVRYRIRFDNTIRFWTALVSYPICLGLWLAQLLPSITPVTAVFSVYASVQFLQSWIFIRSRFVRPLAYALSGIDLVALTILVHYTGGTDSPLCFIYFIPMIVHAFHRDAHMILFNGLGGVFLFASVMVIADPQWKSSARLWDLGARLFFMLLSVVVATLAAHLLRQRDEVHERRTSSLQTVMGVSRKLNRSSSVKELINEIPEIVADLNNGIGASLHGWVRILILEDNGHLMKAIEAPDAKRTDFKQEIAASSCPALRSGTPFHLQNSRKGEECPTEGFSFGSHLCLPIAGMENESFGILFAGSERPNAFHDEELFLFQFIAKSIGLTIQRLNKMEEIHRVVEMDSCVAASFLASTRSLSQTYPAILEGVRSLLRVEQASLMVWNPREETLKVVDSQGPLAPLERDLSFRMGEGLPGQVLEKGEPMMNGGQDYFIDSVAASNIRSLLCVPLLSLKGEPLGVISAIRINDNTGFSQNEIDLISTYVTRVALAVENAALHEKSQSPWSRFTSFLREKKAAA